MDQLHIILTVAGSDSSGGAGIQADLKTAAALGCYGASAITALTAQNTTGVQGVSSCPPEFVEKQIASVVQDLKVDAIKSGMLFDKEITKAVVRSLKSLYRNGTLPPWVCDPVCVSTSGHTLLDPEAITVMAAELFPLATLITPNKSEAELLLKHCNSPLEINSLGDMLVAAAKLLRFGSRAVLLKGGHIIVTTEGVSKTIADHPEVTLVQSGLFDENIEILQVKQESLIDATSPTLVADVLHESDGNVTLFIRRRIDSSSTHGTGCTLSTAIACELAKGKTLVEATRIGVEFTHMGIEAAQVMGQGHGPLNHLHSSNSGTIPRRTRSNPYPFTHLLIQSTGVHWKAYVEHEFVCLLGRGTLPRDAFVEFIKQDYHYLKYYARTYALLAAKSTTFESIDSATQTIINILREIGTHRAFCASFGITQEDLDNTPEVSMTTAYGGYLIDIGLQGDTTKLLIALLACLLGYGEVGLWLRKEATRKDSWVVVEANPYKQWMDDYAGTEYQTAVRLGLDIIESRALADPPSKARLEEWKSVWKKCTLLEKGFWDMAMAAAR